MYRSFLIKGVMAATIAACFTSIASANIWMDENFERASAFIQGTGDRATTTTLDVYSGTQPMTATVTGSPFAQNGTVVTTKAFEGAKSYRLNSGQALSAGQNYQDPQNGNLQTFQFAVNVDPIPAAGTVAEFRWVHDMNKNAAGGENSAFVRLVSTGTSVNIVGGEDLANSPAVTGTIGTLSSSTSWAYITVLVNKDSAIAAQTNAAIAAAYPGGVPPGIHFFVSSNTSALDIPLIGGTPADYAARNWSITASGGIMYLDDMYWDGGMDTASGALAENPNTRPFTKSAQSAGVANWELWK